MASIVLGIMGKKRSGKDTFAARLVNDHGYTRLAFADALKASLLELDPKVFETFFPRSVEVAATRLSEIVDRIGWDSAKEDFPEVRALLQRHGVAMRNHVGENVWVDTVEDVFGGDLVRIERRGMESTDTHISETALDGREADFVVHNDTSTASLRAKADRIARYLEELHL